MVLFLNLFAVFYLAARGLFLKETGRKLAHVEKQLHTGDTIVRDLSERLGARRAVAMARDGRTGHARRRPAACRAQGRRASGRASGA